MQRNQAPNPNIFDPPSAERLARHLAEHPPAPTSGWQARLPQLAILAIGVLVVLALMQPALAIVPMLVMLGLVVYLSSRARAAAALRDRVQRAWELTMIRRYREALGEAWRALPECRSTPELHGRAVTVIAHILGEMKQEEAAEVAYGYLLDRLPDDHPLSHRLRLQRALAALSADRLADADDALRRLRGSDAVQGDPALAATYALARLLQDARTGHWSDAIEQAEQTTEALKPLGVEAGYGHGLLAYCCQQQAERAATQAQESEQSQADEQASLQQQARLWWDRATILIPPAALVFRFPELDKLLKKVSDTVSGSEGAR